MTVSFRKECPRCGHSWAVHDKTYECSQSLTEPPSCGACRERLELLVWSGDTRDRRHA